MKEKFQGMTTFDDREIVRKSGVLLFPKWDLASAFSFNTIRRCDRPLYNFEEEATMELQGSTSSEQ